MLAGVDRSILQFDTAAQLIAPVKHVLYQESMASGYCSVWSPSVLFFGDAHGHGHAHASIAIGTH
jgi:hypothetical protein